jgi:transcriptional regulator with PAS, ATPase and Fis domain
MLGGNATVQAEHLGLESSDHDFCHVTRFPTEGTLHDAVSDVARALVREALRRGKTRKQAADLLGISRHALAHQIKSLGLGS